MTYCNANPYRETVTRVICDACAPAEVPFESRPDGRFGGYEMQSKPWRWFSHYGAPCDACHKPA